MSRGNHLDLGSLSTNGLPQRNRRTPEPEGDSLSSSSNSPLPADESDFYNGMNDSQSSIGATLQDMAVSEEKPSTAGRLPAEVLINIFSKLGSSADQANCLLVSKRWARNCVDLLWHRPACSSWEKHEKICRTLSTPATYFSYRDFIKRLNLSSLAIDVNDGSVKPLAVCNRVERLTLTNCVQLTDGGLIDLLTDSTHLLALDITGNVEITEASMKAVASNCRRLQGLNITGCQKISNDSLIVVAENCKYIKRLKLNDCSQVEDSAVQSFAENCANILEIDLFQCRNIGNDSITALLKNGQSLRELRLSNCELVSDSAFTNLPPKMSFDHLRILDMTSCNRLTDRGVEKIIQAAPRLRNIVFAKCRALTDVAVQAIGLLGKNLHYLHLGHCGLITDASVKQLVKSCNRIRYIDLGCCVHLTDESVELLATLPKLRRIGLVKCQLITDRSVQALALASAARAKMSSRLYHGHGEYLHPNFSSLERVHLSYCTNLTLKSIILLLNKCQKLTHLSLTGVQAFLRQDLEKYCRDAPPEFTEHQRNVFCVFSGNGVNGLRHHLNNAHPYIEQMESDENMPQDEFSTDDHDMTGTMVATTLIGDEEDADGDEELDASDALEN